MTRRFALLILWFTLAVSANPIAIDGRDYRVLQRARHDSYELTLDIASPGAGLDLVFAADDPANYARLLWTAVGLRLERTAAGTATTLLQQDTPFPADLQPGQSLLLRRQPHRIELVAGGRRICRVLAPPFGKGLVAVAEGRNQTGIANVGYQRLEPVVFGDDFMRTEEEGKNLGLWQAVTGDWHMYSVMELIHANPDARIREGFEPLADRSPNPFCLSGTGPDAAYVLVGEAFWSDYRAGVSVRSLGSEFGLIFGAVDADTCWLARWRLHSLGVRPNTLELVRREQGKEEVVATATVPGRTLGWYRFEVESVGSRIEVLIDGASVLTHRDDRAVGGRIGLYAKGSEETLFDDVSLKTVTTLSLGDPRESAPARRELAGEWDIADGPDGCVYSAQGGRRPALLALGYDGWSERGFTATVFPEAEAVPALLLGLRDPANHLRAEFDPKAKEVRLVQASRLRDKTLARCPLDWNGKPVALFVDQDAAGRVRVFADGKLLIRQPLGEKLSGPVGLAVGGQGTARFAAVRAFAELTRNWEGEVDIKRFADDPFMQGWASPRHAWILAPGCTVERFPQTYVHKGDFYGPSRISLPVDDGLVLGFGGDSPDDPQRYELALGIPTPDKGTLILRRGGKALAEASFKPGEVQVLPGQQIVDEKIGALPKTPDTVSRGTLTLHRDGHLVWAEVDGVEVLAVHEDQPLAGRTVTLTAPRALDLLHVAVTRAQVLDYLFETAAVEWLPIGTWEVTNRFACDPRWSHMNGQGKGVAALWNKLDFVGDFTLEYYAGMRMRQGEMLEGAAQMHYPRVGDINVAFGAEGHDLFSGYNVILQAWDSQWSETANRFLRRGEILAENDLELIPRGRHRRPVTRVVEVAWDPGGRPVHGAWYFVKIRKTGNRYDVSFDNLPVFSVTDDEPLAGRRLALWTQQNSIVVARAKVGYQAIEQPAVQPTTAAGPQASVLPPLPYRLHSLTHPGIRLDFEDGQLGLRPFAGDQSAELSLVPRPAGEGHALRLENLYGGGDFGVALPLADSEANRIAHIGFDYAIPPEAKVNLYVSLVERPYERWFVTLSGPDHEAPNIHRLGQFADATADGNWHRAEFDLGTALRQALPHEPKLTVRSLAIGMLHEGYLNAGLGGNPGGAVWHLDNLVVRSHGSGEAWFAWTPLESPAPARYRAWFAQGDAPTPMSEDAEIRTEGHFVLALPGPGDWLVQTAVEQDGAWRPVPPVPVRVHEPLRVVRTEPPDQGEWDGGAIRIFFAAGGGPHLDLARCHLQLGENLRLPAAAHLARYDADHGMLEFFPNPPGLSLDAGAPTAATLVFGDDLWPVPAVVEKPKAGEAPPAEGRKLPVLPALAEHQHPWTFTLAEGKDKTPPSLVRIDSEFYRRLDFSIPPLPLPLLKDQMQIERVPRGDDDHAMRVTNRLCGSAFGASLGWSGFDLGQNPILAFDYRIPPEANVAFQLHVFGRPYQVSLTDTEDERNRWLGQVPDIVADGTWRQAEIDLTALVVAHPEARRQTRSLHVGTVEVGDFGYAGNAPGVWYEMDNLNLIPVASTKKGLELKWRAHDAGGIAGYSYLWDDQPGTEPPATVQTATPAAIVADLPEGRNYFHIRAIDRSGNAGPTNHYTFIVDNTPPAIVATVPANGAKAAAGEIALEFGESVSQINTGNLQVFVNQRRLNLQGEQAAWDADQRKLTVDLLSDWSILRRPLTDGQEIAVTVSGLKDFAGNETEAFNFAWNVDFSQDREPPPAPYLWSSAGYLQAFDHFGNARHSWRPYARGNGNTTVAERIWDETRGTWVLQARKIASGPRFGVFRYSNDDLVANPRVVFDIRILPGTKVNLLLQIDRKHYAVQLTGGDSLPIIGRVPEVKDDGQWHHVHIDLLDMLRREVPELEKPETRMCAIAGWSEDNEVGAGFELDNFGFIGPRPPLPLFNYSSSDATGIATYRVAFNQNPDSSAETDLPSDPTEKRLLAVDQPGMWYIHAAAQDGAGNWSETVRYPYLCTEPVPASTAEGLEADGTWQIQRGRNSNQAYIFNAITASGNKLVALQLAGQRAAGGIELGRGLSERPPAGKTTLQATIYSSMGEAISLRAILRSGNSRRWTSEAVEVPPGVWSRNLTFVFPDDLPEKARGENERWTLGFSANPGERSRDLLIFDEVKLVPAEP